MDFAMQEWSTIVVGLLIVVVLLHAIKSILTSRNEKLRTAERKAADATEQSYGSELPNGGARVVGQRFDETAQELNDSIRNGYAASRRVGSKRVANPPSASLGKVDVSGREQNKPAANTNTASSHTRGQKAVRESALEDEPWDDRKEPSLGEFRDILMESVEAQSGQASNASEDSSINQGSLVDAPSDQSVPNHEHTALHRNELTTQEQTAAQGFTPSSFREDDDTLTRESVSLGGNRAQLEDDAAESSNSDPSNVEPMGSQLQEGDTDVAEWPQSPTSDDDVNVAEPEEWLILNLAAPKTYVFTGDGFFAQIEKAGLRYAKNGGFAYFDQQYKEPLFYLANGTQPGTFPPEGEREDFETASLCLVLALPAPSDALHAFLTMDQCAEQLANDLQGQLTDDERSHYTSQTREHYRQRALQFDRNQLSRNFS